MDISIKDYRIKISSHHSSGRNLQIKFRNVLIKPTNNATLIIFIYLISMCSYDSLLFKSYQIQHQYKTPSPIDPSSPDPVNPSTTHMLRWSYVTRNSNALCHSLNGNKRRLGYKLAFWNCRKGLISNLDRDTPTLIDIKRFTEKHQPHIFGIIETNLHSAQSRLQKKTDLTEKQIKERLRIDGYTIELPDTWKHFGQARILVYVSDVINYKRKLMEQKDADLPNVL